MKYLYTLLAFCAILNANAQTLLPTTLSTNGVVYDMDHDENNLYIGGSFSEIGIESNNFTIIPVGSDRPESDILQPNSTLNITIADGNGG